MSHTTAPGTVRRDYPDVVDVAIVGSGPTGAAYARILAERAPHARVAMFEVGPTITQPAGAHVKNIVDPTERATAQRLSEGPATGAETITSLAAVKDGKPRSRPGTYLLAAEAISGQDGLPVAAMSSNVGGMAAHWTGACPRPGGSERIDFLHEFDELLDDAERLLGVTNAAFENSPFGALVRDRLAAVVDPRRGPEAKVQPMPLAVHRRPDGNLVWSGSDVVMGDVTRANAAFSLHDESLVTRILLEDGHAAAVEVRDLRTQTVHTVRARRIVVAGDALRTPQLLWASGIRPEALGRYLNDQTQVVFAVRIDDAAAAVTAQKAAPTAGLSESSGVSWIPFTDDDPFHVQVMQLDASPVPLADDDLVVPGSIVGLGLFCAKDLQRDDRITFSEEEQDGYGMPAMGVQYRLTDNDRAVLDRGRDEIVRLGSAIGTALDPAPFTMPLGASLHYQGTTRMGLTDDGESVCGPTSEVWAAPGVFVAGNGVIPTATACNPTLTSVALAIAGARHIADALIDASGEAHHTQPALSKEI